MVTVHLVYLFSKLFSVLQLTESLFLQLWRLELRHGFGPILKVEMWCELHPILQLEEGLWGYPLLEMDRRRGLGAN